MAKVEELLNEIYSLNTKDKQEIYQKLKEDLRNKQIYSIDLKKYRGIAKKVWNKYAQEYIDEIRNNDRV